MRNIRKMQRSPRTNVTVAKSPERLFTSPRSIHDTLFSYRRFTLPWMTRLSAAIYVRHSVGGVLTSDAQSVWHDVGYARTSCIHAPEVHCIFQTRDARGTRHSGRCPCRPHRSTHSGAINFYWHWREWKIIGVGMPVFEGTDGRAQ